MPGRHNYIYIVQRRDFRYKTNHSCKCIKSTKEITNEHLQYTDSNESCRLLDSYNDSLPIDFLNNHRYIQDTLKAFSLKRPMNCVRRMQCISTLQKPTCEKWTTLPTALDTDGLLGVVKHTIDSNSNNKRRCIQTIVMKSQSKQQGVGYTYTQLGYHRRQPGAEGRLRILSEESAGSRWEYKRGNKL